MGEAIGEILPLAVGVALSPIPIIGVVLMLGTPQARRTGPAFIVGWVAGLSVAGAIILAVSGSAGADEGGAPSDWVGWLKLALGVLLLIVATRNWRGRPREDEASGLPAWMQTIDRFTVTRATALGIALSAVNPKNLLLTAAAAAAIAQTGIATRDEAAALAVFVLVATLGPGVPVAIYFAIGERATEILDGLKRWMATHNPAIMAVIFLIIAAKLIGDGISILSG